MAGFFGLFGGKTKYIDEVTESSGESSENEESFYLSPDEAKTLGNIEFMRKPNTIKHTFAKTGSGEGKKIVKSISSWEKKAAEDKEIPKPTTTDKNSPPAPERRSGDSNLDIFRKMARDMKK